MRASRLSIVVCLAASACGRVAFDLLDDGGQGAGGGVVGDRCDPTSACRSDLVCLTCQPDIGWCGDLGATTYDAVGAGTVSEPYVLGTAAQWIDVASTPTAWASHYCLGADVDLVAMPEPHAVIGTLAVPFSGSMNGGGHTLMNYRNTAAGVNGGVFGYVDSVAADTIVDLEVRGVVVSGGEPSGGLIGHLERGTIRRVAVTGCDVFAAGNHAGGLVGSTASASVIEDVLASCVVAANANGAGGLVGHHEGRLGRGYSTSTVSGRSRIGGLFGRVQGGIARDAFTIGPVTGDSTTGNVNSDIGDLVGGTISGIYFDLASVVVNNGSGGIAGPSGIGVDRVNNPASFSDPSTEPLVRWDFSSVWTIANGVPVLWFMGS